MNENILIKFIEKLNRDSIVYKNGDFFKGKATYNTFKTAQEFLLDREEDIEMAQDLIKRAKERLEKEKVKVSYSPSMSLIPEIYTYTYNDNNGGGVTKCFIRRDKEKQIYSMLNDDFSNMRALADTIIRNISDETLANLNRLKTMLNSEDGAKPTTNDAIVIDCLTKNRDSRINVLDEYPKTFTTRAMVPARVYFDLSQIPLEAKETPAWDSFVNRLTIVGTTLDAREYFKAFIWSIFEEGDKNRVFLYLQDKGKQGKSVVINTLGNVLKGAYTTFDFLEADSHSTDSIVDARLIVQHEGEVRKLSNYALVKKITGNDKIYINPKGKKGYSVSIDAKIIALGNKEPIVGGELSEWSRLLPIKVNDKTDEDFIEGFQDKMNEEVYDFLSKCRVSYNKLKLSIKDDTFLSIDDHIRNVSVYKDHVTSFIQMIEEKYEITATSLGSPWKVIQKIINNEMEEDNSYKQCNLSSNPQFLDFLESWAKAHGGKFIRVGARKGFSGLQIKRKEIAKVPESDVDKML